jgi:hypothetical protein
MSLALGAVLSAIAGAFTGVLDAWLRDKGSVIGRAIAGAGIAAACYGLFIIVGLVVGLLTFSTTPAPWPALIGVVLGGAAFLVVRLIHSAAASHFGMPERLDRSQPRSFDDLLDARPRGGAATMLIGGVVAPLLPIWYGVNCILTRRGELGHTLFPSEVEGAPAIALGLGWIGVGLFLHFHFFFGLHPALQAHSRRGKTIAVVIGCAGLMVAYAWAMLFGSAEMLTAPALETALMRAHRLAS